MGMEFKKTTYLYLYSNMRIEVLKLMGEWIATAQTQEEDGSWKDDPGGTISFGRDRDEVMMQALIGGALYIRNVNLAKLGDQYRSLEKFKKEPGK